MNTMHWTIEIMRASWDVLVASAPYMLLGFFVAGLLKAFLPDALVARHLGGRSFAGLLKASAVGVPMPLCSCGVLPTAAGLRQQGAGKGPTAAFLISTPETGVDSIAVTWALLDPFMALIRPVSAFITAMVTGGMVQFLEAREERRGDPSPHFLLEDMPENSSGIHTPPERAPVSCQGACQCGHLPPQQSPMERLRGGMAFAFGDLFQDIAVWFMAGVLIAGGIAVFLTPEMVSRWLGNPFMAMVAMVAIAVPLYVCATASTPIAAALVLKGLNPGAALVFLLAGPAVNAASLTVISRILGRRMTGVYVAGIILCALGMGLVVDEVYALMGGLEGWRTEGIAEDGGYAGLVCAVLLLALFGWKAAGAIWRRLHHRASACTCGHCH